jgi:NADP-dependent alcohol dehydrogenase
MELIMQEHSLMSSSLYKVMFETKKAKAQYGKRIFNLEGTDDEIANEAINKTVEFFHKMGMDTKLSDYTKDKCYCRFIVNRLTKEDGRLG